MNVIWLGFADGFDNPLAQWRVIIVVGIVVGLPLLAFAVYLLVQLWLNTVVIPTIVLKSLRQHALSTVITAASIGLGCGLLMSVLVVSDRAEAEFTNVTGGFDCLLGQKPRPMS